MPRENNRISRDESSDGFSGDTDNEETGSIDFDNLDLARRYTFKEFETINERLKTNPVGLNDLSKKRFGFEGHINHFEYDAGFLIPMPETPIEKEATAGEIFAQLRNWNVQTGQNGVPTTSQGGFNFTVVLSGKTIRAPDVAFTPKETYRGLSAKQRRTFRGKPFHPSFVVEVEDLSPRTKLGDLTSKFKETYFPAGVMLGWLIDPINKTIYTFKKDRNGTVRRRNHGWRDISGGNILPDFTLEIWEIEQAISQVFLSI